MQRKSFLYLFAILALLVAMVPMGAAAQPAAPTAVAAETVGSPQLPTARDAKLILDGPAAPAAPPANPAAILFDNGPLTTNPGGGAGGANASALQTGLGLTLYGFNHAISAGFRMADDFTVPAGGWNISTITFYAYQTGSTTTTTINNVNLQIWNGVPGAGGSSVVFGDTTTNRLAGSSFSNIYRVLDTALTNADRPVMANVATVNTTLPAGTYWLDWQTGGTLASGPWAPPVSILGQTAKTGANGLQYSPTTAAWAPALDGTFQQDLPFVIEGATAQGPSISLAKTVGTTNGVCAGTSAITVPEGTTVYYCYTVTNTGTVAFGLHTLTDDVLGTIFTALPYTLAPGASVNTVQAGLTISAVANATTTNVGTWLAYNATGGQATANATATVTVIPNRCPVGSTPVTVLSQDFSGSFPPAGWVVANSTTGCVAPGVPDWTNTDPGADGNLTGGSGAFADADSDSCGSGSVMNAQMWSAVMNLTGLTNPQVTYYTDYNDLATGGDLGQLDFSVDGGTTWTNLISWDEDHRGPLMVTQPFAAANQANTTLRWNYINATWDWWWQVDSVEVTACQGEQQAPNINVTPASLASTQATNTTTNQTLTVANTGGGTLNWTIAEEPAGVRKPIGASRGSQRTATRQVSLGDASFSGSSLTAGQVVTPERPATPAGQQTITHSTSQSIIALNSVSCNAGGLHTDNSYLREFDLTAFGISGPLGVTQVEIGVEQALGAGGSQPITVNLYTKINPAAPLTFANLSSIGTANATVTDQSLTLLTVPVVGTAPAGSVLVVEIFTPDGQTAGHSFFIGSNNLGQTAPSYLAAADCGVTEPTNTAAIGFPGMHIVMNVTGDVSTADVCANPADVPWLSEVPTSGATAGGASTPVQVTFNSTGLAAGTYNATLCVDSNDPDPGPGNGTDLVIVPVALTVTSTAPNINVSPLSLASTQAPNTSTQQTLTVGNTGGSNLTWTIAEEPASPVQNPDGGTAPRPATAGATGSRSGSAGGPAPIAYTSPADFSQGFDDITTLPGLGWFFQNNSDPLGLTDWFQGNDTVFPAQAGAATAYIGANFNNTGDLGTISNWMLTPELALANGDTISFWTRQPTASTYPDRLQVRLSTAGASTNVGTLATDVGDFTTLLLDINPTLAVGGYPDTWTQFTATLSSIPGGATGRIAWRYFVTDAGFLGSNSDYIGIDTVEFTSGGPAATCDAPSNVPWLSEVPTNGTTAGGASTPVQVTFNSTGLAAGTYNANLCVDSNDPDPGPGNGTERVIVPVQLVVEQQGNPAIELNKTVGTVPGVCATTNKVTVPAGTEVYYCYQVENTGDVTLNFHDLDDSELGEILDDLPYTLAPGAFSPQVIVPETINITTTNVATWTAVSNLGGFVVDDTIPYNWEDISQTGTAFTLGDDEVSSAFPVGFGFDYFGTSYSNIYVSSNGFLTVLSGQSSGCCQGQPIPTPGDPDGVIAGWWEDLDPGEAGAGLYYQTLGSAPNRVFIVQFSNVQHFPSGTPVSLEYKLFEGSDVIEVHYQTAPSDGGTHSAGVENQDGTVGVQYYLGTGSLGPRVAVRYTPAVTYVATDSDFAEVNVLYPNIFVDPLSMSSTQPPNVVTSQMLDVANTGTAPLTWQIAEANTSAAGLSLPLVGSSVPDGPSVDMTKVKIGDSTFSRAGTGAGQTVTPSRPATPESLVTITHSTSQSIVSLNSVSCNAGGLHTDNSYMRVFDLDSFGLTNGLNVTEIEFGVETALGASGSQPVTVNLYVLTDPNLPLTFGNLTPIGTASVNVADQSLTLFTVPVTGAAPAGSVLVVEVFTPEGQTAGNSFFIGSNSGGETGPSYLAAADCGVTEPTPTGAIGFPEMQIVMNVTGDTEATGCSFPTDVPWLSETPTAGTNAPATSTPVQVSFDSTGLAIGTYTASLCITSNDPDPGPGNETELVQVPVTLTVQGTPAITVAKTVGTVPGVCAATSNITVPMGTMVYYCYTVTNTGDVTLNSHTLVDDKLGTIFTNFAYALTPGSSVNTVQAGLSIPAVINVNTTNVATWTAAQSSTGGLSATATATARVNIITLICNDEGEGFDNGVPPLGWTVVSSIPGGPQWTTIAGCGELGNYASGNGGAACASGLNYPDGNFDTELRTPPFSLVGWTGGDLNFQLNFQSWAGIDRLTVDISNNGGTTWSNIRTYNSDQGTLQGLPGVNVNLDLTPWAGQANLKLRWRYYSTAASPGWYAQVDEVKIKCSAPPPTAVSLASLSAATNSPLPVPAGLPVAALPAVASLALGAAYVLRRKR